MQNPIERRSFLTTAVLAAPAVQRALGQNEKINIGWIGAGTRGYHCLDYLYKGNSDKIKVTAVCDTYAGNLARGKDRVQTMGANTPATSADYREMLADKSIDAVFIMTPEHLHHSMMLAALKAGKHVYVEKPLAHTIEEGAELVKAAQKSGKIVQVGTQNRSSALYRKAKEMVQQGMIGDCHYVRAFWYRNSAPNHPAWRSAPGATSGAYAVPPDANPQNTDWDKFLGPAPKRGFDPRRYFQWRLYWDYSGGISTDLLVHQTDIVNFVLGKTLPHSCMATGAVLRWTGDNDDREVPDTLSALYDYPDKFHLNYSCYFGNDHYGYGEQFCGNEGTIEVISRQDLRFFPQVPRGDVPERVKARQPLHLNGPKDFGEPDGLLTHIKNFIEAIRGNEKVVCPPEAGQQAAISGHMATLALKSGKKVVWDPRAERARL
ncbi:MAG: Gfo/Idh/MocA family protein [Bryobacteraceae bacterium]